MDFNYILRERFNEFLLLKEINIFPYGRLDSIFVEFSSCGLKAFNVCESFNPCTFPAEVNELLKGHRSKGLRISLEGASQIVFLIQTLLIQITRIVVINRETLRKPNHFIRQDFFKTPKAFLFIETKVRLRHENSRSNEILMNPLC